MQVEEVSFVNDMIQDARINAREEQKYNLLIRQIFNNCKLNWNNDGLILKSDDKLFNLIEVLEPKLYDDILKKLQEQELKKDKNKEE